MSLSREVGIKQVEELLANMGLDNKKVERCITFINKVLNEPITNNESNTPKILHSSGDIDNNPLKKPLMKKMIKKNFKHSLSSSNLNENPPSPTPPKSLEAPKMPAKKNIPHISKISKLITKSAISIGEKTVNPLNDSTELTRKGTFENKLQNSNEIAKKKDTPDLENKNGFFSFFFYYQDIIFNSTFFFK